MQVVANLNFQKFKPVLTLGGLMLVALALLWFGVLFLNQRSEQQGLEEMRRETAALALLFATHTDTTFRTVDLALNELRNAVGKSRASINEVIAPHLQLLDGAVVQAGIVDAQGMVTYSTPIPAVQPTFAGDREFFTVHQGETTDRLFVGRPVKGRVSNQWSIHLSRPVYVQGQFAGVVLIAVNPDYFVNFYQKVGMGQGGAARMIRDTGEVMARSSDQEKYVSTVIKPSPYADPGAPLQGSFRRKAQADGVDRLSSYYRLAQYGVTVVIGPSVDARLATVRAHQQQLVWAASAISLMVLLIGWLLLQSLRKAQRATKTLERSEKKFRRLFESMTEGVAINKMVYDATGKAVDYQTTDINPAFERLTGLSRDAIVGQMATQFLGVDRPPSIDRYAEVLRTDQSQEFEYHYPALRKDFLVHAIPHDGDHFAIVLFDETERKMLQSLRDADLQQLQGQYAEIIKLKEKLQNQALHDPLTQLHNRRYLNEALPRELARARREGYPVAMIVFDIDHFKKVNDTHGHAVGDLVLSAVAQLLAEHARESDIMCRFGGEEFLMALSGMDTKQACQRAEEIRRKVSMLSVQADAGVVRVTISAGVACYPAHGTEMATLFVTADAALYQAKSAGRDRVVVADAAHADPTTPEAAVEAHETTR